MVTQNVDASRSRWMLTLRVLWPSMFRLSVRSVRIRAMNFAYT